MVQSSEFIRGYSEVIITAILTKKDSYVYEIVSLINELSNGEISISNPSVMIILKKMIQENKVIFYEKRNDRNVIRKYYKITEKALLEYQKIKGKYIKSLVSMQYIIEGKYTLNEE